MIESKQDIAWFLAAGGSPSAKVLVSTSHLTPVALWYAYELIRNEDARDMMIDRGYFLIALNDDVNYGWCHYRKRAESDEAALEAVKAKFGDVVELPLKAMMSEREVGLW